MSATTTSPPMTAEEFIRQYGDANGVELIRGQLVRMPMPGAKHGQIGMTAGFLIKSHVVQANTGRVFGLDTFIRTRLDGYRGADVGFISYDRLPKHASMPDGPLEVAPELVVEVRSPTDRWKMIKEKIDEYHEAGISVVMLIDPNLESVSVWRADEFPVIFHNGDTVTVPDVLPGFAAPVKSFFE